MRTNIVIDDRLMADALAVSGLRTKKDAVEAGLRLLVNNKLAAADLAESERLADIAARRARIMEIVAYTSKAMKGGPGSADIDALLYDPETGLPK